MCRKNRKKEIEEVDKPASEYTSNLTFQEIELLNSDLYRICGEMHENKDFINNPVLKSVMWKEITKAYIAKSNEIKESKTIPEEIRRWTLEEKNKLAIPDYELLRRFPLRKYGLNEVAKQCMKQAQIGPAPLYPVGDQYRRRRAGRSNGIFLFACRRIYPRAETQAVCQ